MLNGDEDVEPYRGIRRQDVEFQEIQNWKEV